MSNRQEINAVGVVVIGRNEGERLKVCLQSLQSFNVQVVYVDSGSTDGSVSAAKSLGANVLNLDMQQPFTAARARNAGFAQLMQLAPNTKFVQFVDGDCEVVDTWLTSALEAFKQYEKIAVVCGRRKERFPNQTFYNLMCDLEWNTPVGQTKACGGDALMRVEAFQSVDGFNDTLIAGEEPELCVRLRQGGWTIQRIAQDMTIHDAAMTRFSQWWKRTERAGHAFGEGAYMHGNSEERHWVQEARRPWLWAFVIPLLVITAAVVDCRLGLMAVMIYPLQFLRLAYKERHHGVKNSILFAVHSLIGKFAELKGQLSFHWNRLFKKKAKLIEYK